MPETTDLALSTLAEQINSHHAACERALGSAIEHALAAGKLLIEAKDQCRHGGWLPWLQQNFKGTARTAQRYMRLADRLPELEAKNDSVSHLTMQSAMKLLAEPADDQQPSPACHYTPFLKGSPESRHQLVELWWDQRAKYTLILTADGWGPERIAEYMGVPVEKIDSILDPRPRPLRWDDFGADREWQARCERWYCNMVDLRINGLLLTACGRAVDAAQMEGFSPQVIADLQAKERDLERRRDRLQRGDHIDFDCPKGWITALICMALTSTRVALGIEAAEHPFMHMLVGLTYWLGVCEKHAIENR